MVGDGDGGCQAAPGVGEGAVRGALRTAAAAAMARGSKTAAKYGVLWVSRTLKLAFLRDKLLQKVLFFKRFYLLTDF